MSIEHCQKSCFNECLCGAYLIWPVLPPLISQCEGVLWCVVMERRDVVKRRLSIEGLPPPGGLQALPPKATDLSHRNPCLRENTWTSCIETASRATLFSKSGSGIVRSSNPPIMAAQGSAVNDNVKRPFAPGGAVHVRSWRICLLRYL